MPMFMEERVLLSTEKQVNSLRAGATSPVRRDERTAHCENVQVCLAARSRLQRDALEQIPNKLLCD